MPARQRLQPEVRARQILDAALVVFAEHGYIAARMDDIARRCGLSKGGLYAHFSSKEAVFEALMTRALTPPDLEDLRPARPLAPQLLAAWLVDRLHALLANPATLATMRLLVAESERVPHLAALWHANVVQPHLAQLGDILRESAAARGEPASLLAREPWLAIAPAVHLMLMQLVLGPRPAADIARARDVHVALICELLERPLHL